MNDIDILSRITTLADEEHALERSHAGPGLAGDQIARLREIESSLDRCWDLLRQRRARRQAGQDPDLARPRPASTVEGYEQ